MAMNHAAIEDMISAEAAKETAVAIDVATLQDTVARGSLAGNTPARETGPEVVQVTIAVKAPAVLSQIVRARLKRCMRSAFDAFHLVQFVDDLILETIQHLATTAVHLGVSPAVIDLRRDLDAILYIGSQDRHTGMSPGAVDSGRDLDMIPGIIGQDLHADGKLKGGNRRHRNMSPGTISQGLLGMIPDVIGQDRHADMELKVGNRRHIRVMRSRLLQTRMSRLLQARRDRTKSKAPLTQWCSPPLPSIEMIEFYGKTTSDIKSLREIRTLKDAVAIGGAVIYMTADSPNRVDASTIQRVVERNWTSRMFIGRITPIDDGIGRDRTKQNLEEFRSLVPNEDPDLEDLDASEALKARSGQKNQSTVDIRDHPMEPDELPCRDLESGPGQLDMEIPGSMPIGSGSGPEKEAQNNGRASATAIPSTKGDVEGSVTTSKPVAAPLATIIVRPPARYR
ncbi:unnamed protein product [Clonostachys rosea]|uniref:Uncharacterized protein n=1 Tax=Bionectria ochroleuca TaxID=29856 RepID=A0ABY6U114_BIOOC|nr:unnamed protein product [Clonostachys rosea]